MVDTLYQVIKRNETTPAEMDCETVFIIDHETCMPVAIPYEEFHEKTHEIGFKTCVDCTDYILTRAFGNLLSYLSKSVSNTTTKIMIAEDEDALLTLKWFIRCYNADMKFSVQAVSINQYQLFIESLQIAAEELIPRLGMMSFSQSDNILNRMKRGFNTMATFILLDGIRFHFVDNLYSGMNETTNYIRENTMKKMIHYFSANKIQEREDNSK